MKQNGFLQTCVFVLTVNILLDFNKISGNVETDVLKVSSNVTMFFFVFFFIPSNHTPPSQKPTLFPPAEDQTHLPGRPLTGPTLSSAQWEGDNSRRRLSGIIFSLSSCGLPWARRVLRRQRDTGLRLMISGYN